MVTNEQHQEYIKNYETLCTQLEKECNNLKEAIETQDPLTIDFKSHIQLIENLKIKIIQEHYKLLQQPSQK